MYTYVNYFGPAAITLLVAHGLSKKDYSEKIKVIMEIIAYTFMDLALRLGVMKILGKSLKLVKHSGKLKEVQFTTTSVYVGVICAILLGIIVAFFFSRFSLSAKVTEKKD